MKLKTIGIFLLFIGINCLFVLKYATRIDNIDASFATLLYALLATIGLLLYPKFDLKKFYKHIFILCSILFFAFTLYLNFTVDGNDLNVDRWSAMQVGIEALLDGRYPYAAVDHLNGRTSNLPTLIFIGTPFYLLGNIGLLQSFCFLLFLTAVTLAFKNYKCRLIALLFLIFSPAYLWEVYVKSDLMSNFIIILLFAVIVQNRLVNKKNFNVLLLSFLSTSLILTRIIAIIPISLVTFKEFLRYKLENKIQFAIVSILTITLLAYICFHNVENIEQFLTYNPLELQNRQLPTVLSFIFILLPFLYSSRISNLKSIINSSAFLLTLAVATAFLITVFSTGLYESIFYSAFDISYFNMALPFVIFSLIYSYQGSISEKTQNEH